MSGKTRASLLSLTIIAVIMFSAFGPTTVSADGDPPPDGPPAETTTPPEEASTEVTEEVTNPPAEASTESANPPVEVTADATESSDQTATETTDNLEEAPAADNESAEVVAEATTAEESVEATSTPDAAPTETASTDSEEAATTPPAEEAAPVVEESTPAPDTSILNEVPPETVVTVLDADGTALPLATQEAEAAIAASDPIWCPQGAAPVPETGGCTESFPSFDGLLTFLAANPSFAGPGTIFVEQGAYQGGEASIDFSAYNLGSISSADLSITGGWNISTGTTDPTTPSTFNNIPILIGSTTPWGGSLTISNISMSFPNGTGTANGLTLNAQGSITLIDVSVTNAPNNGAQLDAGANVSIINSKFSRNQKTGAQVNSGGGVTVINSEFSNPADARKQDTGLDILKAGSVTLFDVIADENRLAGANINASGSVSVGGTGSQLFGGSSFSGTKEILGTQFLGAGLNVTTTFVTPTDAITISNVTANDNFLYGASLNAPGGGIAIVNSFFNANTTASPGFIDDTGVFITSTGDVALTNVVANDNRLFGANIAVTGTGTVTVSDSQFNNNRGEIIVGGATQFNGHGLKVTTELGGIFLDGVTANNNMLFGAELDSGAEVSVIFSEFSDNSTGSSSNVVGTGLDIVSTGNTSLHNVILNNNQTVGATIQASDVSLSAVTATNNGSDGVVVLTSCTEVIGGTYTGNGGHGLNLGTSALALVSPAAGDIFPASPATCALLLASANTGNNVFASLQTTSLNTNSTDQVNSAATGTNNTAGNATLNNILAKTMGSHFGVFIGKYAAVYSSSGLHIIAYSHPSNELAMDGS